MFNIGGFELLVIAAVALLVLGPDKLPKFMRTVGKTVGQVRRVSTEFQRSMNLELTDDDPDADTPKNMIVGNGTEQNAAPSHEPPDNAVQTPSAAPSAAADADSAPAARRKLARPKGGASGGLARSPRRTGSSSQDRNGPEQA